MGNSPEEDNVRRFRWWTAREKELLKLHYGPLSKQPWPLARIAEALGVSTPDAASAAYRYGLSYQTHKRISELDIMSFYQKGFTDVLIARAVQCDRRTVWMWRKRNGLPRVYKGSKRHDATTGPGN